MRRPTIIIAGFGLAAMTAVVGVAAASASGSAAPGAASTGRYALATVRTAPVSVGGTTETILIDAKGLLPLYYYGPDTATTSFVTGELARSWPPLMSAAPTGPGLSGKLTVLNDVNGNQVAYNGHPLYTFTGDHPGQVTGQGFQNFYVATPGLAPIAPSAPSGNVPAVPAGGGYGY